MKTTDIIKQLQELVDKNGDCEFHVYGSFTRENLGSGEVFYDDELKDICIGIYA